MNIQLAGTDKLELCEPEDFDVVSQPHPYSLFLIKDGFPNDHIKLKPDFYTNTYPTNSPEKCVNCFWPRKLNAFPMWIFLVLNTELH